MLLLLLYDPVDYLRLLINGFTGGTLIAWITDVEVEPVPSIMQIIMDTNSI